MTPAALTPPATPQPQPTTPWPTAWVVRSPDALRALPEMKRAANGDDS